MKYKLSTALAAIIVFGASVVNAKLNLPIKTIGGEQFYYYQVKGNESVDGVAKKLGVSAEEITRYNPSAKQGLSKKQLLFFPLSAYDDEAVSATVAKQQKVTHVVKNGETLWGISKIYDISVEKLISANPGANTGIKTGDVITIPTGQTTSVDEQNLIYHTIESGESIYGVAKKYNTSIESLLQINPGIYPNNFVAGDVIRVMPNNSQNVTIQKDVQQFITYVVKKNDTFEKVASSYNVSVEQLKEANPDVKKLKNGRVIYVPQKGVATTQINSGKASAKELERSYSGKLQSIYNEVNNIEHDGQLNIAMVLPFQLQKQNPPRIAHLYTDFYKGFYLAVDSICAATGRKVNLSVFDTQHNLDVTDSILSLPKMKTMDIIIAPGEPKQLERCNQFGKENNITVVNGFSSKNDDYASNPNVVQLNMPVSYLASALGQWIEKEFKDYEVIFLADSGSKEEEICSSLKHMFLLGKKSCNTINVLNELDPATVSQYMDPGSNYLFIPVSENVSFLQKVIEPLKEVKKQRFDCETALLGHPDYLTVQKKYKDSFKELNTYVYSRFFIASEKRGAQLAARFKAKFGNEMISTFPSMGTLGFDMGEFVLKSLEHSNKLDNDTPYFDGIEMDVELKRSSNWGGFINRCIEIVHFTSGGVKESVIR